MRVSPTTAAAVSLLLFCGRVSAQQWNVDLYDITNDDPLADRIRAESVEFMPNGKTLVTAGFSYDGKTQKSVGEVRLRSAQDGSLTATLRGTAESYALRAGTLACSPTGQRIAAAGRNHENEWIIDVFDATSMKQVCTLKGNQSPTTCLAFSPQGKVLAAAHVDGTIDLWDYHTGKMTASFVAHADGVWPITFSADGTLLAIGNEDGSVTFRDAEGDTEMGHIPGQPELKSLGSLVFSPNGKLLAVAGFPDRTGDSPIFVWELRITAKQLTPQRKAKFKGHGEHTYSLAFSPDGRFLASANQDTTVRIWDIRTHNHLRPITQHKDFVYDVAFSPNGTSLATLGRDSLKLWIIKQFQIAE